MKLEAKDRRLLLFVIGGLALVVFVIVALVPQEEEEVWYPSSYSARSGGAKAAFLTLRELGYQVQRWERPPAELPEEDAEDWVLILAQPFFTAEKEELEALERFLARGGRIVAVGRTAAMMMPEGAADDPTGPKLVVRECRPLLPSRLTRGGHIQLRPVARWKMDDARHIAHFAHEEDVVVASYGVGRGEVVWWAEASPLVNASIREAGNLELLLNSVGAPEERKVLWDEYFHGFRQRSLLTTINETPARWALAQLGLVVLAVLLTFARRSGPVRPLPRVSRLTPLEFVETLGGLYQRAGAARVPVEVAYARFRYRLARRLGSSAQASPEELARGAREQLGLDDAGLLPLLQACHDAGHDPYLKDAEALKLVQRLARYAERLRLIPIEERMTDAGSQ